MKRRESKVKGVDGGTEIGGESTSKWDPMVDLALKTKLLNY